MIGRALTYLRAVSVGVERANDNFISSFHPSNEAGASSCVQYSADRQRAPQGSTDKNCAVFLPRNFMNENNPKGRTEMSDASTGIASTSPISRDLPGQRKLNSTLRTSLASILGRAVAGLLATMSHRRTRSVSCSARSCADITNTNKRRPF